MWTPIADWAVLRGHVAALRRARLRPGRAPDRRSAGPGIASSRTRAMTAPPARWPLSGPLTSLPLDFPDVVAAAAGFRFTHVDVVALADRPQTHREMLAEAGVLVACASLGRNLPEGVSLDALSVTSRRAAVEVVKQQINDAAQLGATTAYLIPPLDDRGALLARVHRGLLPARRSCRRPDDEAVPGTDPGPLAAGLGRGAALPGGGRPPQPGPVARRGPLLDQRRATGRGCPPGRLTPCLRPPR